MSTNGGSSTMSLAQKLDDEDAEPEPQHWVTVRSSLVELGKRMGREPWVLPPAELPDWIPEESILRKDFEGGQSLGGPSETPADLDQIARGPVNFADATVEPPFPMDVLCEMLENSNSLRQNLDAMSTNVDGFGHSFDPVIDFTKPDVNDKIRDLLVRQEIGDEDLAEVTLEDVRGATPSIQEIEDTKELWSALATIEKGRLDCFFDFINPVDTFTEIRRRTREHLELVGNAGWEVIREVPEDSNSKIAQVYFVPFVHLRLIHADRKPTKVDMKIKKDAVTYETVEVERFFRRFVRVHGTTTRVYYKEFGDPRVTSRTTGRRYETVDEMRSEENEGPQAQIANELFHWKIYSSVTPYGIPRWIGSLLSVLGSRAAEEVNFLYFDNKAMPPMAILVQGGRLSEDSVTELRDYIENHVKGRKNFWKILLLEALPANADVSEGDLEHSGKMRIEFKSLMEAQPQDALYQKYDDNNVKKVGRAFRQPPILTGDTRDQNRSCYSEDTETLTENGWKFVDEIAPDEKIAAFDLETGRIVFEVPEEKLVYGVEDELLYRFETSHTDVFVTHDHRMLYRPYYERTESEKEWRVAKAEELTRTRFRLRVAADPGSWQGDLTPRTMTIPKVPECLIERGHDHQGFIMEDWLEFLGYWISEGCLLQTDSPLSPYLVSLAQKKPLIRDKIQACLDRLPWKYSSSEDSDGTRRWYMSNRCLRDWLLRNCGGSSHDKKIPSEYLRFKLKYLTILYEALMDGDGSRDPRENRTARAYYSASSVLAGQVQQICVQLGYRAMVNPAAGVLRVNHSEHVGACVSRDLHVSLVPYTGRVYCFSVPKFQFFVTRRNGKVAIQGNTALVAKAFAEEQVYQPARDAFDAVMDRHVLSNHDIRFWKFRTKAPVQRIPNDLVANAAAALRSGAITPNEARPLLGDAFSVEFEHRTEDWAQIPPELAKVAARDGSLVSAEPTPELTELALAEGLGEVVARGDTGIASDEDEHSHRFVVVRMGQEVRAFLLPSGGEDLHSHQVRSLPNKVGPVTVTTEEEQDHHHELQFDVPLSKRARKALNAARGLRAFRESIMDAVEEAKDEWFDASHQDEE